MGLPNADPVPVEEETATPATPPDEDGIGIALSGGGYRAMLYHAGVIVRLYEFDLLQHARRISSVSGGSIAAGALAFAWDRLNSLDDLYRFVVAPLRELASSTIDRKAILRSFLFTGKASEAVSRKLDTSLFGGATLQDVPDQPEFTIVATNLESGRLWRFQKDYMRDWKIGRVSSPTVKLADAVTASAAFPPILSPFILRMKPSDFDIRERNVPEEFFREIALTDGGVYDNYGLEPIWKRYGTVLVSDGGAALDMDANASSNWPMQLKRVLDVIHAQVHALRSRTIVGQYKDGIRDGAFFSIATPPSRFKLQDKFPISDVAAHRIASISTRLKAMDAETQERLINFGYVQCDNAIRAYYRIGADRGAALPYPDRSF